MKRFALLLALLGLGFAVALLLQQGMGDVLRAFSAAGMGIVWTNLFHIVPLMVASYAWILLWPGRIRPSLAQMTGVMLIRCAVNNLLPVARIGGEVVAARLMIRDGWRRTPSIATVVVETTMSVITVFIMIVIGIMALALRDLGGGSMMKMVIGALVSLPIIVFLLLIQRIGIFGLLARLAKRLTGSHWRQLMLNSARLDLGIATIYRRRWLLCVSAFWMLVSWYLGGIEIWLGLYFLGTPLPLWDCMILESMIQLVSSAAFVVPGALGVQEGGFLFFGGLLGLPPEQALALALIRRCRDLVLYLPALLFWLVLEGKSVIASRARAN
jgi:glycosyltransferase 2 family protein